MDIEATVPFCYPIRVLEDDRITLAPFTEKHGHAYYEATAADPLAFAHFSSGPYDSAAAFIETFLLGRSYPDRHMFTFAIVDKAPPGSAQDGDGAALAGMVSLVNADEVNRRADIGLLHVVPGAQSQGTGTRAAKLLLEYGFSSVEAGGLGLVRMEWRADSNNGASAKLARRLGFREIGTVQYEKLLKDGVARGKTGNGRSAPPGTASGDLWRDVAVYEMTFETWQHNK
ncbi:hypothetical protein QQS21_010771 [Conoideocrella luteorostrata]|uniref:N-acetyltransferase domain-containing protein n=1 Tax=Conoideocrella luteorostrata TaxID=1105319 RepID=A0AAJ0FP19_9HYPO|nr:hypothetical protein QQS21_010771 [Conoideocrella luteorostrata]